MKLVNCLSHQVSYLSEQGNKVIPPSGNFARIGEIFINDRTVGGVTFSQVNVEKEVVGLPAPEKGVLYIVSRRTFVHLKGVRDDVIAPDTGSTAMKSEDGRTSSVTRFLVHDIGILDKM